MAGALQGKSLYTLQIGIAVILGSTVGLILGPKTEILGEIGILFIRLLKALATPLVFFAIVDGFLRTQIEGKSVLRLFLLSGMNALVAGGIALSLAGLALSGVSLNPIVLTASRGHAPDSPAHIEKVNFLKGIGQIIPQNVLEPFLTNNVISVVLISVLVGLVLRNLKRDREHQSEMATLESFFRGGFLLSMTLLSWIVRCLPIAVFGVLAKVIGESGLGVFSILGHFLGLVIGAILLHVVGYYSLLLVFVARVSPLQFFRSASEAILTAFGTGSSLATLPVTLKTLQEKMKISPESSRLSACIGTNLNHAGILLYEAIAALFVAQVHGIPLGLSDKAMVFLGSTVAAIGIAGVPDAGLITLSLVLSSVGLPLTLLPVLMTIDWLLGRFRATANVTSDMVVATILDKFKSR